jgi:hypothetical protein
MRTLPMARQYVLEHSCGQQWRHVNACIDPAGSYLVEGINALSVRATDNLSESKHCHSR